MSEAGLIFEKSPLQQRRLDHIGRFYETGGELVPDLEKLGIALLDERTRRGMSLDSMSLHLDLNTNIILDAEQGNAPIKTMMRIAKFLGMEIQFAVTRNVKNPVDN